VTEDTPNSRIELISNILGNDARLYEQEQQDDEQLANDCRTREAFRTGVADPKERSI
jgi:hypothetical protein